MTALGPDEELGLRAAEMEDEEGLGCGEEQSLQLNLGDLDLTSDEFILDEVDIHIQANLEDSLVQEALKTGVDLRQYSKQVELELRHIEHASIKDYTQESKNITSLHNQITACDAILEHHPGGSSDGAGVPGAAARTQQQDQLCEGAGLPRDHGLRRRAPRAGPAQGQGCDQDPGVRPAENLLLPQAHDQLPDPPERPA
uniref:Uncharacterized protein n=1 Tax=Pelodiscus sinensis TaxID=13735 RepID=K7FFH9_PELSI